MGKKASYIFILIMSLALLGFTAGRTLDLLQLFLPDGQGYWAWLGLAAFDIGLIGWTLFYAHGASGSWQRALSLIMVGVSLIAVAVSTTMDMYIAAGNKGIVTTLPVGVRVAVLFAVGLVVVSNVVAFFLTHIWEPERQKALAEEAAKDKIHDEVLKQINEVAPQVAAQVAPILARKWVQRVTNELVPGTHVTLEGDGETPLALPFRIEAKATQNGHHKAHSARNGSNN